MATALAGGLSSGAGDVSPGDNNPGSGSNPKMRKRTKTGCLTCRKRRIKCGEERPTCANCIKSKRQCEGYNQRVVFKPPIGDWPNHPGVLSTLQYHNSSLPGTRTTYQSNEPAAQPQDSSLSSIQPRPMTQYDFSNVGIPSVPVLDHTNTQQGLVGGVQAFTQESSYQQPLHSPRHQQPLHSPHHQLPTPTSASSYFSTQPSPVHAAFPGQYGHNGNAAYEPPQRYPQPTQYQQIPTSYDTQVDQKPSASQPSHEQALYQHGQRPASISEQQNSYLLQSHATSRPEEYPRHPEQRPVVNRYNSNPQMPGQQSQQAHINYSLEGQYAPLLSTSHADLTHSSYQPVQIPQHDVDSDVKYMPQHAPVLEQPTALSQTHQNFQPQLLLGGFGGDDHVSPTQVLDEAAVEYEDDDYYDVQSDEEMLDGQEDKDEESMVLSRDFSLIRRLHSENTNDLDIRRYDAFIYEGILSHYRTEQVANPLKNPKTARVFAHFIHVTGPSLSIYERNPRNPTSLYEGPIPPSQQSLWTYILPLKALNHQGLLHAMLALASLHIAKLQKASVTPSYKHYAYALKRLGRSLGNPKRRLQLPTLATSLLLAFYEVMTAEHVKWSTHLVGAAQLLNELDFRSLTQEARRLKGAQIAQEQQFPYQNPDMLIDQKQFDQRLKENAMTPDETLVSTIVGKQINYDDFGRVFEEGNKQHERRKSIPEKLNLRSYETLQDLYWWYAKQDVFQSIVSGNPLIMAYRRWSDCPPRAPLGRTDMLYGSHDHVLLLVGRIADFIVRDRERKIRQVEANGGQWKPTPGMPGMGSMGPPPSQGGQGGRDQPTTPTTPMGPPPHMQGMGPAPGRTGGPPPGWNSQAPPTGLPPSAMGGPPGQSQGQMPQQPPRGGPPPTTGPGFYGMAPSRPTGPLPTTYANTIPNTIPRDSPPTPNTPHPKFSDLPAAYEAALADWNSISHAHATIATYLSNTPSFAPLTPDMIPPVPGLIPGSAGNMTPFGPALLHRSYDISILWALLHLSQILLLRSHPAMPPAAMVAASVCAPATQPYAILIGRIAAGLQVPMSEDTPLTPALGAALIESTMSLFFAGVQYQDSAQREWLVTRLLEIDRRTGWASAGVIARSCETSWEKAAEMGRGPPYERRRTRRFGEEGPVSLDPEDSGGGGGGWGGEKIIRNAAGGSDGGPGMGGAGLGDGEGRAGWGGSGGGSIDMKKSERDMMDAAYEGEKRFVVKYQTGSVPWAMNLLATEEDLRVGMERVGLNGEINVAGTYREKQAQMGQGSQQMN